MRENFSMHPFHVFVPIHNLNTLLIFYKQGLQENLSIILFLLTIFPIYQILRGTKTNIKRLLIYYHIKSLMASAIISLCSTSKEISGLEGELISMKNLLSTQAALVHDLAEKSRLGLITGPEHSDKEDLDFLDEKADLSKTENWITGYLEKLEVLLAEKRVEEAMTSLQEGERMAEEIRNKKAPSPSAFLTLQAAIGEQRTKLADQLAETMCQPSTRRAELRSSALALKKLGDGPRAHTLLLNSHQDRLQRRMPDLRSTMHTGGAPTATLSKLVFSTIAQAMNDSLTVFGQEEPAYTSELVTWAVRQADTLASFLKKHVLSSTAASGGLRVSSECIHVCLNHCYVLEACGLALSPVLLRQFRPFIELALNTTLKRIDQSSAARAAVDDWLLVYSPTSRISGMNPSGSLSNVSGAPKLTSSAHKFNIMVQVIDYLSSLSLSPLVACLCFGLRLI